MKRRWFCAKVCITYSLPVYVIRFTLRPRLNWTVLGQDALEIVSWS